jgi:hypothetical protein
MKKITDLIGELKAFFDLEMLNKQGVVFLEWLISVH